MNSADIKIELVDSIPIHLLNKIEYKEKIQNFKDVKFNFNYSNEITIYTDNNQDLTFYLDYLKEINIKNIKTGN